MEVSLWYHVDERLPPKPGYYLTYVGYSLSAANDDRIQYNYYNGSAGDWTFRERTSTRANVKLWTDIDLESILENHVTQYKELPIEKEALNKVIDAAEWYKIVKNLTQ